MKRYFFLCGLLFVLVTGNSPLTILGQSADKIKKPSEPKYKIVNTEYIEYEGKALLVDVVIKPDFLNRVDMKILAGKIKSEFANENNVSVGFFMSKKAAKHFTLQPHSKSLHKI